MRPPPEQNTPPHTPGAPHEVRICSLKMRASRPPPAAAPAGPVGASRYMSEKLTMDPTTRVANTKSSSLRPQLGREAMSPTTAAPTPMICSAEEPRRVGECIDPPNSLGLLPWHMRSPAHKTNTRISPARSQLCRQTGGRPRRGQPSPARARASWACPPRRRRLASADRHCRRCCHRRYRRRCRQRSPVAPQP